MRTLLAILIGGLFGTIALLYRDNLKMKADYEELRWRHVSLMDNVEPYKLKPVDMEGLLKVSRLTGIPVKVLVNAHHAENGVVGYEFGYKGKTRGVVENFRPDQWQCAEWGRRMDSLVWNQLVTTPAGHQVLIKAVETYTGNKGKKAEEYAATLAMRH